MSRIRSGPALGAALVVGMLTVAVTPGNSWAQQLRVCADPGNMPLSNNKGEGLENKMAEVLAAGLGTTVSYYYRPSVERGLIRNTLDADLCDVMLDMPPDSDDVLATAPLYRTTFVFVSRSDRNIHIKSLDDPQLKKLKIGVYETSAIREALSDHGINGNLQVHYLSHDADLVPKDQPSYQIQQVIDHTLDLAATWGPFAGYYKAVLKAPVTIQPANLMDDEVPLQFDMALAVRRGNRALQKQLEQAMRDKHDALRAVLNDFGVPLVQCGDCIISGDLPAHGPYTPQPEQPAPPVRAPKVSIAQLDDWLAHGASVTTELNNAVLADDQTRVGYLLEKKHADVNSMDLQGETPLHHAVVQRSPAMVQFLIAHGADVNERDRDGWTPIMTAAYCDDSEDVKVLASHGADPNAVSNQKLTALGVAAQYGKYKAALTLIEVGADPGRPVGDGGYTPLMLASANDAQPLARALLAKGADVNAKNSGGVTALMMAAANGRAEMVELLMRAGANVQARTERGDTALSIARDKGNEKVIKLLGEAPAHPGA
ncbi:MAG TPA: quinoprotein dehydrogenase-associated putative ABC transporter substrate-binding protein [Steroidobacteraceae bacterium]|nr:quinoprotein dehydrogenase-associated putative ABC transporter substrate-binding protein [Steroidobacteraceae bacterium]